MILADKKDVPRARVCLCCLPSLMLGVYLNHLFLLDYFFMLLPICPVLPASGLLLVQNLVCTECLAYSELSINVLILQINWSLELSFLLTLMIACITINNCSELPFRFKKNSINVWTDNMFCTSLSPSFFPQYFYREKNLTG